MTERYILMSTRALSRIDVLEKIKSKQLTQELAAQHLGLSGKQVNRLYKKYRQQGA
jgi:hypothetical protein